MCASLDAAWTEPGTEEQGLWLWPGWEPRLPKGWEPSKNPPQERDRRHNAANDVARRKNLTEESDGSDGLRAITHPNHGGKNSNRSKGQMLPGEAQGAGMAPQGRGLCLSSASNTPGGPRGPHSFPECPLCSPPTLANCKAKRLAAPEIHQQNYEVAGCHGP